MKMCTKCGLVRTRTSFYTKKTRSDGLHSQCKSCMNADHRRRDHSKRKKIADPTRAWPSENWSVTKRLSSKSKLNIKTGCIEWFGAADQNGYGVLRLKSRTFRTHRLAFENARGNILKGMYVLHTCDNPSCINPEHLFLGTQRDNMKDMTAKRRHWRHT